MQKRSQAATELIIVMSIGISVLLVLIVLSQDAFTNVHTSLEAAKSRTVVDDLGNAAEKSFQQGAGSKTTVYITIPDGVQVISVANQTLRLNLWGGDRNQDFFRNFPFNITGSVPITKGSYWIAVKAEDGFVVIGDANDTTVPSISNVQATVSNNSATITWATDEKSDSRVYYDTTPILNFEVADATEVLSHSVLISGLINYTLYYFVVQSCDSGSNCANSSQQTFITFQNAAPFNETYHVDDPLDEVIYFGAALGGVWNDTNISDGRLRELTDAEVLEDTDYIYEGFESSTFGTNWTTFFGTGNWSVAGGVNAHNGSNYAVALGGNNPPTVVFANLTLNPVDLSGATSIIINFYHECQGLLESQGAFRDDLFLEVWNGTHWEIVGNWTGIDNTDGSCPSVYALETFNVTNASNEQFQIRFRNGLTWNQESWRIDDLTLTADIHHRQINASYLLDNINPHTTYWLSIVGHTSAQPLSIYADGVSVATLMPTRQLNDSFERSSFDSNWTRSGGGDWIITTIDSNSGTSSARGQGDSIPTGGLLTFSPVDLSGSGNGTISFFHRCSSNFDESGPNTDTVYLDVFDGSWNTIATWVGVTGGGGNCPAAFAYESHSIADYLTSSFQFRFRQEISNSNEHWFIDDITVNTTRHHINVTLDPIPVQDGDVLIVFNQTPTALQSAASIDLIELHGITT